MSGPVALGAGRAGGAVDVGGGGPNEGSAGFGWTSVGLGSGGSCGVTTGVTLVGAGCAPHNAAAIASDATSERASGARTVDGRGMEKSTLTQSGIGVTA